MLGLVSPQPCVYTPFTRCTPRGDADCAFGAGAKVNTQDDWGETPLHAAIAAEQQELVTMLVEAGTDTSLKNNEGKSCADLMIEEGHRYNTAALPPLFGRRTRRNFVFWAGVSETRRQRGCCRLRHKLYCIG